MDRWNSELIKLADWIRTRCHLDRRAKMTLPAPPIRPNMDHIQAWFQPQISCDTGQVTGFEALARLNDPIMGIIPPARFLYSLSTEERHRLTETMLRQALSALRQWDREGWQVQNVSVNVTALDLSQANFADLVFWELDRQDISASRLVLEVLENIDPATSCGSTARNLSALGRAGCRFDLDDFGTGFARLDSIRQFGIHRLKIDQSFITGCDHNPDQSRMILAILAMADHLGLQTLGEGVETSAEHGFLAQIGCQFVQGFAIAAPMHFSQTSSYLAQMVRDASDLSTFICPKRA